MTVITLPDLPYPFLSLRAAYAVPIIMMSQNRQATKDRVEASGRFRPQHPA
jgi:uncharacterized membrane protein